MLGVKGGLIATAVMSVYRLPVFRALPPTAAFWAQYVGGGDAAQYPGLGLVLHFLYGGVAGGVFGLVFDRINFPSATDLRRGGLVAGVAYGLLLSAIGDWLVFRRLLDEELDADEALVFHVGHVVYGLTLGTWMGTREAFGEIYD